MTKYYSNQYFLYCLLNCISCDLLENKDIFNGSVCNSLPEFNTVFKPQIRRLSDDANKIIEFIVNGTDSGETYRQLAKFVDRFGPRVTGTQNLENSIDYMVDLLREEGHNKVYTENVQVPTWVIGKQWARMLAPVGKSVYILGSLYSVGTNGKILTGDVVIVKNSSELDKRCHELKGRVILYNPQASINREMVYRNLRAGVDIAANCGAIALLGRSFTPLSIYSPHVGLTGYNESTVHPIPDASITVEDTDLIQRYIDQGEKVVISLYMETFMGRNTTSRNTISDIVGTEYPEQIVLISGHIDTVYVGQGAMDDGAGAFISWRALSVINKLGLKPKRTIRCVLWTAEEFGRIGAQQYAQRHRSEQGNISIALESDDGTFAPSGLYVSKGSRLKYCIIKEVLKLLKPLNASQLTYAVPSEGYSTDLDELMFLGISVGYLVNKNDTYYYFHHSNGDTMTVVDSYQTDLCTAVWAVISYVFASIDQMLPR